MYGRLVRNDMAKSKLTTATTMAFIAAAAMLVFLALFMVVHLLGAIDNLMTQSKTPHFMQMHSGTLDEERLKAFAQKNSQVEEFQVLEFLNMEGADILLGDNSLISNVQDNGLCIQSDKFDFLLDLEGRVIRPKPGELYVPLCYFKDGTAKVGDRAVIHGREFRVAGFLRDSQMNSTLSSSKRFLVSQEDFEALRDLGNTEYLIEFRLKDLSMLGAFETAYIGAGLEANGPTITYPLFKMVNAISDGIMMGVILLISALVVAIAFMCIRFTLLAKIEEDYREIGVLKAIGIRVSDIKKIYQAKYAAIGAAGCVLGLFLALVLKDRILENIRLFMGESHQSFTATLLGITGIILVFLTVMAYVNRVLKRFKSISVQEALRYGTSGEPAKGAQHFTLSRSRLLNVNVFLGIKDVLARKKLYGTMLVVLVLAAFIMIVPINLRHTLESERFIGYMGIGQCDILINIQQTTDISEKAESIVSHLAKDKDISKFALHTTKAFKVKKGDGSEESIKVQLGDHQMFPIAYSEGRAPVSEDEIALSVINAQELGYKVGDVLTLVIQGRERAFKVSGIYSDITNGGKTAKAVFSDKDTGVMWCTLSVALADKALVKTKLSTLTKAFPFAKILDIEDYAEQILGPTINAIGLARSVAIAIALTLSVLVTLLFMRMLVAKDSHAIAILKSLGFTNNDLRWQYGTRSVFVLVIGFVLGTLLANTLGQGMAGGLFASMGAASFRFETHGLSAYVIAPLAMALSVFAATVLGTWKAGSIKLSENIKE